MVSPYLRVSATSAARRSETAASRAGSVSSAGGVRRDVGREVGQHVGELGDPVGELGSLRVVLAHPLERGPGGGDRAERVGPVELARQRLARALGGDPQRVGVAEPGLLGGELDVLARLRVDLADLLEAEPQQVGLAGAVTGVGGDVVELALGGAQLVVERRGSGRAGRRRGRRRTGRARRAGPPDGAAGAGRTGRAPPPAAR